MWDLAYFIFLPVSCRLAWRFRGNRSKGFYKKSIIKILVEVTGKHLCFPMNFKKFLRRPFHKHLGTAAFKEQHLLLDSLFAMFQLFTTNRQLFFHEGTVLYFSSKILECWNNWFLKIPQGTKTCPMSITKKTPKMVQLMSFDCTKN